MLQGRCLCGASHYEASATVKFSIQCYCRDCQQMTGTGHLPQSAVPADSFRSTGPIKTYTQKSDAGSDLGFSFCGKCGSPLFKTTSKAEDLVFVTAGSLDDSSGLSFEKKVFESGRQNWDKG